MVASPTVMCALISHSVAMAGFAYDFLHAMEEILFWNIFNLP